MAQKGSAAWACLVFCEVEIVQWIHDKTTGFWYGSSFVKMATLRDAERVVEAAGSLRIGKRGLVAVLVIAASAVARVACSRVGLVSLSPSSSTS